MTLEASIVLPIFLLLFMNLLSIIEVYRIHSNVAETLWENGRKMAQYGYLKDRMEEGIEEDYSVFTDLLASVSARKQIVQNLETYPVWEKMVRGRKAGFTVVEQTDNNGIIRIDCNYQIHPLISFLTPVTKMMENHYYGHAWTGYEPGLWENDENVEDIYVYITETGTVYHRNRYCSYLNPSIQKVSIAELGNKRNESGAIYYACPLCDDRKPGMICYITNYGTNYHTSSTCSGLKRTIYTIKLSEAGDKGPCSKCGG